MASARRHRSPNSTQPTKSSSKIGTSNPDLSSRLLALEKEMRFALRSDSPHLARFYSMMHYHFGWADSRFRQVQGASGKRIRPLLCLLVCEALSDHYAAALPAASAIEIVHNFSLVHDDIEDSDELRRHRKTLWTLVGVPQAINVGDGLFALAQRRILALAEHGLPAERVLHCSRMLQDACIRLVQGQFLDLSAEKTSQPRLAYYQLMIGHKTAALFEAAAGIGAAVATENHQTIKRCSAFGFQLGLAFQMSDDILGLWGEPALTGKPIGTDLRRRKLTLPVVLTLRRGGRLAAHLHALFAKDEIDDDDIADSLRLMQKAGIRTEAECEAETHHRHAMQYWKRVESSGLASGRATRTLLALIASLIHRTS